MKGIPEKIYLQWNPEDEDIKNFDELGGVTWASHKINDNDAEYVRVKKIKGKIKEMIKEWDRKNPNTPSDTQGAKAFDAGYKSGLTELLNFMEEK